MLGPVREEAAPLLGRAHEQSLLMSLLDGAAERWRALVLRGDPGIGKSRLLSVAAQAARSRDDVLNATGAQSEAQLPFDERQRGVVGDLREEVERGHCDPVMTR